MNGYIAVDRGIFENGLFANAPFSEREAWLWLVAEAAWREREVKTKVGRIKCERGQCVYAVRFLAEKWKWDRGQVYRFLKKLISANSIRTASEQGMQQITICNYEKYQNPKTASEQQPNRKRDKEEPLNQGTIEPKEVIGADAPADPTKVLIDRGIILLARQNEPQRSARGIIGLWRKSLGDDVLSAIFDDVEHNPKADLKAWIGGIIRFHKTGGKQNGVSDFRAAYEQAIARLTGGEVEFGEPPASRGSPENVVRLFSAGEAERPADLHGRGDATVIELSRVSRAESSRSGSRDCKAHQIFADDS